MFVRILDGIRYEVEQHLIYLVNIKIANYIGKWFLNVDLNLFALSQRNKTLLASLVYQTAEIALLNIKLKVTRLHFAEVENLLQQVFQACDVRAYQHLFLFLHCIGRLETLVDTRYHGKRCQQFV